jgi:hypothetical protein
MPKSDKAAKKQKRPPRQVWLLIMWDDNAHPFRTRKAACAAATLGDVVAGPYVLAERVRQR